MAPPGSQFRYEKRRIEALVTLAGGESVRGAFFVADGSPRHLGQERIGDLLNQEPGFFPLEINDQTGTRTVLYNRAHILTVALFDDEARRDSGYDVATPRSVSLVLSDGRRVIGNVRVYRPEGRDRVSDWTRQAEPFFYIETAEAALIVNAAHIVAITEVPPA